MIAQAEASVSVFAAVADDKSVVENLIQLYLYDMSGDLPFPIGRDGKFQYDYLDRFWQHPYLIFQGRELAGFALIIDNCPVTCLTPCFFMAEFFVLRAYRGKGVGKTAVMELLQRHSGLWHIAVIDRNEGSSAFWSKVLADQDVTTFPEGFDGENWLIYEFTQRP